MTKLQKNKKGFTLVELAVVIAVIAILIAVLVPTFMSLISSAQKSADQQLVKNLNTAITIEDPTNETNVISEALEIAQDNGYTLSKISPTSDGCDIAWDEVSNRFVLMDGDTVVYYDSSATDITNMTLWYITDSTEILTGKNYYYTAADSFTGTITVTSGADLTALTGVTEVVVNAESASGTDVITVVVPSTALVVNNSNSATVNVYGTATTVTTTTTYGNSSLHIYGEVTGKIEVLKGRVVAESGSYIESIIVTASSINDVEVVAQSSSTVKALGATNETVAAELASSGKISGVSTSVITTTAVSSVFAGGTGTEASPYLISSIAYWINFRNSELTTGGYYWSVTCDLDFSETSSKIDVKNFTGYIDFNGNIVSGIKLANCDTLYSSCYGGLFCYLTGNTTIANLNYEIQNLGTDKSVRPVMYAGKSSTDIITLYNVTVTGSVVYSDNNASIFVYLLNGSNTSLKFENCINHANITNDKMTGVFIGRTNSTYTNWSITFDNCVNYSTIQSTNNYASMLISNETLFNSHSITSDNIADYITINNCVNYGSIYGSSHANLLCGNSNYDELASAYESTGDLVNLQSGVCAQLAVKSIDTTTDENNNSIFTLNAVSGATKYTLTFSAFLKSGSTSTHGTYILYEYIFNSDEELSAATIYAYNFKDYSSEYQLTQVGETDLYTTEIEGVTYYVVNYYNSNNGHYYLNNGSVSVSFRAYDESGTLLSVQSTSL